MKSRVIQLVLLLIAGAIVNVAVAWGCVMLPRFEFAFKSTAPSDQEILATWNRYARSDWPQTPPAVSATSPEVTQDCNLFLFPGCTQLVLHRNEYEKNTLYGWRLIIFKAGFPFKCLEGGLRETAAPSLTETVESMYATQYGTGIFDQRALPVRILWLPLVANTLFYATILFALVMTPVLLIRTLRRILRQQRGLCPACAYPTWGGGTSPVCTECGGPISIRASRGK